MLADRDTLHVNAIHPQNHINKIKTGKYFF